MAKPYKLKDVDAAKIAAKVNEEGQLGAALDLGVSQSTVSSFLRKHNYRAVTVYVGEGETVTITETGASVPYTVKDGQS